MLEKCYLYPTVYSLRFASPYIYYGNGYLCLVLTRSLFKMIIFFFSVFSFAHVLLLFFTI